MITGRRLRVVHVHRYTPVLLLSFFFSLVLAELRHCGFDQWIRPGEHAFR